MTRRIPVLLGLASVALASPAAAQQPRGRFNAWLNGGAQAAMPALVERFTFEIQAENATVDADYHARARLLFDGGFAVRRRRNVAVGVSLSRFSGGGGAGIVAQIPYPFEFDRFPEVSGTTSSLRSHRARVPWASGVHAAAHPTAAAGALRRTNRLRRQAATRDRDTGG